MTTIYVCPYCGIIYKFKNHKDEHVAKIHEAKEAK